MNWLEGEIVEFPGKNPKHADLRKIRTRADQDWDDMHFFHVDQARLAGYPNAALAAGRKIEFHGEQGQRGPKVARFKPYQGEAAAPRRSAGGDRFLNPYHFIPLHAPEEAMLRPVDEVLERSVLHHRFGSPAPPPSSGEPPLYSGRILCRLETEGPVVLGSEQKPPESGEDRATVVAPFELRDPGGARRPAIPGSSLRGLISSLVEAASCSAMRVLGDASYTRRALVQRGVQEALSAIGMLVEEEGRLELRPLTMSLEEMKGCAGDPPETGCRVLVGQYRKRGDRLEPVPGSFLAQDPLSWSASNRDEFWYCDLSEAEWYPQSGMRIGIRPKTDPISEAKWKQLAKAERDRYTRGVLLVVGLDGSKAENLPKSKKYEFFLPYDPERGEVPKALEIEPNALKGFKALLQDAAGLPRGGQDQDYPYLHRGRKRDRGRLEPRAGDLVYYEKDPGTRRVRRLAYTAIWRRLVPGGLWAAVSRTSPDLVPFHPGRKRLSLAERLFGFVEQREAGGRPSPERRPARALASRVRFSHALAEGDAPKEGWYEREATLKILASPKPPSPALYFGNETNQRGKALSKSELDLTRHAPQGRKVYLHHRQEEDIEARCYETREPDKNLKQKLRVSPLRPETRFLFHVDFHNLERAELGYLLYALRPTEAFRHKLGLGKPIGLGRVRIDRLAVGHIDRPARYRAEGLFGPRYAAVEPLDGEIDWNGLAEPLRNRYRSELAGEALRLAEDGPFPRASVLADEARAAVPQAVRSAIEQVGDPAQVGLEVTYPVMAHQPSEGEHFRWFVANDRRHGKRLEPLTLGEPLPALERYTEQTSSPGGRPRH